VQGADEFPWKNKALALEHWLRNAEPPGCNAGFLHVLLGTIGMT
jgi:hypothetical protein